MSSELNYQGEKYFKLFSISQNERVEFKDPNTNLGVLNFIKGYSNIYKAAFIRKDTDLVITNENVDIYVSYKDLQELTSSARICNVNYYVDGKLVNKVLHKDSGRICIVPECKNLASGNNICMQCRILYVEFSGSSLSGDSTEEASSILAFAPKLNKIYAKIAENKTKKEEFKIAKILLDEPKKEPQVTNTETVINKKDDKQMSYEKLKARVRNGGVRLAGRELMKLSRIPMAAAIAKIMDVSTEKAELLLNSDLGKALSGATVSLALKVLPESVGKVPDILADELQEEAIANAGESVLQYVTVPITSVIRDFFVSEEETEVLPALVQQSTTTVKVPVTVDQNVTVNK